MECKDLSIDTGDKLGFGSTTSGMGRKDNSKDTKLKLKIPMVIGITSSTNDSLE